MIKYKWLGEVDIKSIDKVDILREEMQDRFFFTYNDKENGDIVFSALDKNYKITREEIEEDSCEEEYYSYEYKNIKIYLNIKDDILFVDLTVELPKEVIKHFLLTWCINVFYKKELEYYLKEIIACHETFKIKNNFLQKLGHNKSFSYTEYICNDIKYLKLKNDFRNFKRETSFDPIKIYFSDVLEFYNYLDNIYHIDKLYKEVEKRVNIIESDIKDLNISLNLIKMFIPIVIGYEIALSTIIQEVTKNWYQIILGLLFVVLLFLFFPLIITFFSKIDDLICSKTKSIFRRIYFFIFRKK